MVPTKRKKVEFNTPPFFIMLRILVILIFVSVLTSCRQEKEHLPADEPFYDWESHVPFTTSYQTFSMPVTDIYNPVPEVLGEVEISEASGLAYSINNPGMIWTHNDSGHSNTLYLLDAASGQIMTRYKIMESRNLDWEDMEISTGPDPQQVYLYIGDIGDNAERRNEYSIYRFREPVFEADHVGKNINLEAEEFSSISFVYPDGSHDAEGLMVDPATKDIYVVTKRDIVSTLYVLPYPQNTENLSVAYKVGAFSFREASAASSAMDGSRVLIKNRQEIFYWERQEGEAMHHMLERTPVKAPYTAEPQGEAICFDPSNNYFTLSEALNSSFMPKLYKYQLKQ